MQACETLFSLLIPIVHLLHLPSIQYSSINCWHRHTYEKHERTQLERMAGGEKRKSLQLKEMDAPPFPSLWRRRGGEELKATEVNVVHRRICIEEVKMRAKLRAEERRTKYEEAMRKAMAESVCAGCVRPRICEYCCVVAGDGPSSFACRGCGLPVPEVLPRCNVCGHDVIPFMFCCRGCVHGYSVDSSSGVCCLCGRRQVDDVRKES